MLSFANATVKYKTLDSEGMPRLKVSSSGIVLRRLHRERRITRRTIVTIRWMHRKKQIRVKDLGKMFNLPECSVSNIIARRSGFGTNRWEVVVPVLNKDGYEIVPYKRKNYTVHQLVLLAFVGKRPAGYQCCHADGNKRNNNLLNLRWDTAAANQKDRDKHGTSAKITAARGVNAGSAKLKDADVQNIRKLYSLNHTMKDLGKMFGVDKANIHAIIHRKTWKHVI